MIPSLLTEQKAQTSITAAVHSARFEWVRWRKQALLLLPLSHWSGEAKHSKPNTKMCYTVTLIKLPLIDLQLEFDLSPAGWLSSIVFFFSSCLFYNVAHMQIYARPLVSKWHSSVAAIVEQLLGNTSCKKLNVFPGVHLNTTEHTWYICVFSSHGNVFYKKKMVSVLHRDILHL